MSLQIKAALTLLRRKQLEAKTGLSRSAIYARLDPASQYFDPEFPAPIKLGNGKNPPVAWISEEIDLWIEAKKSNSRLTANEQATALPQIVESRSIKNLSA